MENLFYFLKPYKVYKPIMLCVTVIMKLCLF